MRRHLRSFAKSVSYTAQLIRPYIRRVSAVHESNSLLCFLHIPKTAGTSLRLLLWDAFGRENVFWHGMDEDGFLEEAVQQKGIAYLDRFRVIGGHIPFSNSCIHSIKRRKVFAAVMRSPVNQLVSHFEFVSQRAEHPLYAGNDLEQALAWGSKFRQESTNMQCRYIANRDTALGALQVITRTPYILGCVEKIDLFVDSLAEIFTVPRTTLTYQNVQEQGYFERRCTARVAKMIREITAEDEMLYRHVLEKGVITNMN